MILSQLTQSEKDELARLVYERETRKARQSLLDFTKATHGKFKAKPFHEAYYHLLDLFAEGQIPKLIITMPPQHGKSEGSTRRLPAYLLGKDPDLKIAVASYNTIFASKFNRDIQRIIDSRRYRSIFPKTTLNATNVVSGTTNYLRNTHEFEIVGYLGGVKAVGRGGALTGHKVDVMIMDDLYKDYMEGNSPIVRDSVRDWYTTVVSTRLHNDSRQLIVFTRWHEEDLIGTFEAMNKVIEIDSLDDIPEVTGDMWIKVNFAAIKEDDPTDLDPREKGEALWPEVHAMDKLLSAKEMDVEQFNCLFQGNPMSSEGLLYSRFKTYTDLPPLKAIHNYTDTADTGTDKLCSIVYGLPLATTDQHLYVIDVLYTASPMEVTEPETISLLEANKVNRAKIESNNGGRGFARVVQRGVSASVQWFHQSANKEARIFSNSASVTDRIAMPSDWHLRWPDFYRDVTRYKKVFKANKYDDGPDALTGIVEEERVKKGHYVLR